MSAHAGILHFDSRPVDRRTIDSIHRDLSEFGPDHGGTHVDVGLAMIHRALWIGPEDRDERQPYFSPSGLVVTWDGRLDNRDDLICQLHDVVAPHAQDAAVALAAYERWDCAGLGRMVGDWSLAIWNPVRRTLILSSDYAGNRPLYYYSDQHHVAWSSSLGELLQRTGIHDVSTHFVVGYLTLAVPPGTTPYARVSSVLPAHAHVWTATGDHQSRRVWDFSADECTFSDPSEYSHTLRALFTDAVRVRMRSLDPVWAELSGGFDSSAIVCIASLLTRQGCVSAPSLETVSYSTDIATDERTFVRAVEEHCGLTTHHLMLERCFGARDMQRQWITPIHPGDTSLHEYNLIAGSGAHVVMSGYAGDLVMGNTANASLEIADHVRRLEFVQALAAAHHWSRSCQRPIWSLIRDLQSHTSTSRLAHAQRRVLLGDQVDTRHSPIDKSFQQRYYLRARYYDMWNDEVERRVKRIVSLGPVSKHALLHGLVSTVDSRGAQSPAEWPGIRLTFPYLHRPLVSFVLSLPPGRLATAGQPRHLMKSALSQILPSRVLHRISKGHVVDPFRFTAIRAFARDHVTRVDQLLLVRGGYVEPDTLRADLREIVAQGVGKPKNLRQLVRLEGWLQALNGREGKSALVTQTQIA